MPSPKEAAEISKVIEQVAGNYCRRVWWADKLDLMQEAWLEVLAALARKPVPPEYLRGTVYRIAVRRCAAYLWEQSAPVTGARGRRSAFAGLRRKSIEVRTSESERKCTTVQLDLTDTEPSSAPNWRVERAEAYQGLEVAREELYWRVTELYTELLERTGRRAKSLLFEAVLRVLVDGQSSTDNAQALGVRLLDVYDETATVKNLIINDATSQELLEEIESWRAVLDE